jgi:hypothetical protein
MGILLLVAVIIGALVQTGVAGKIADAATDMVQAIAGGGQGQPERLRQPGRDRATPAVGNPGVAPATPAAPATRWLRQPGGSGNPAASPTRRRRRSSA